MKDLRFGDFDGDHRTDIFYTQRPVAGLVRPHAHLDPRGDLAAPISELLFGEFDGVRGTDVAAWPTAPGRTRAAAPRRGRS